MTVEEFSPGFVLYSGNMFGGKTAHAILACQRADEAKKKVQAFRIDWDDRYGSGFITANNGQLKYPATMCPNLDFLVDSLSEDTELIYIEELQFWDERVLDLIKDKYQKTRILSTALPLDYRGNPFPFRSVRDKEIDSEKNVGEAMAISTRLKQFWPTCDYVSNGEKCGHPAYFPQRWREDGTLSRFEDETVKVGAKNAYLPVCEKHFARPLQKGIFQLSTREKISSDDERYSRERHLVD